MQKDPHHSEQSLYTFHLSTSPDSSSFPRLFDICAPPNAGFTYGTGMIFPPLSTHEKSTPRFL